MKTIYLTLILCCSLSSYSQEYGSDFPKAIVKSTTIHDTITYTFTSNYLIDDYKAPMLEKRLLGRYSNLIDISILYDTQTITFKILNADSELFLEKLVKHFRYNGYELN